MIKLIYAYGLLETTMKTVFWNLIDLLVWWNLLGLAVGIATLLLAAIIN